MNADEIVERVNRRCPELDPVRAHDVTVITMRTLGEHLSAEQADALASVLPAVFAEAFDAASREKRNTPIETSLAAFEEQLLTRAEIGQEVAANVARAVARVLRTALIEEHAQIRLELPPELDRLLHSDSDASENAGERNPTSRASP